MTMTKLLLSMLSGLTLVGGLAGDAFAARCRDVAIHVHNNFEHDGAIVQIKIVDFDYWDDGEGKWREENWVGNTIFDPGEDFHPFGDRNLEYVGGESDVVIRVQFKYLTQDNGWS